ncbi:MAG: ISL3 family transposase [Flavobacteriaceae bacterium]|nr:ISL3 family transposase [Flavobacteriaceae bacterium]
MDTLSILAKAKLHLGTDWKIELVHYDEKRDVVDLYLSYVGTSYTCPETGQKAVLDDHRKQRVWRHLDVFRSQCYIHCRVPRVRCSSGKVKSIQVPWADTIHRFTTHFEYWAIDVLLANGNQYKTAQLLRCGAHTISRIMHRAVERGWTRRSLQELHHLSIDEKAYKRRHHYATVVSDPETGFVLDLIHGRHQKATQTILNRLVPGHQKPLVQTITTDMWHVYVRLAKELLPDAFLIHDRFHLIKYLNRAIDAVRRREVQHHAVLKNSRFALWKNPENRTEKQDILFEAIQQANLQASKAWKCREDFKAIFHTREIIQAKERLTSWLDQVKATGIQEVMEVAKMFQRHLDGIIHALVFKQSNARAERINGKIQQIKTVARGYRKFENFRSAVLFFCGGLKLYPH